MTDRRAWYLCDGKDRRVGYIRETVEGRFSTITFTGGTEPEQLLGQLSTLARARDLLEEAARIRTGSPGPFELRPIVSTYDGTGF